MCRVNGPAISDLFELFDFAQDEGFGFPFRP